MRYGVVELRTLSFYKEDTVRNSTQNTPNHPIMKQNIVLALSFFSLICSIVVYVNIDQKSSTRLSSSPAYSTTKQTREVAVQQPVRQMIPQYEHRYERANAYANARANERANSGTNRGPGINYTSSNTIIRYR